MKKTTWLLILSLFLLTACGGGGQNIENPESTPEISTEERAEERVLYTSFYPIYDLTRQIAGDKWRVEAFTDLTKEAHHWEPSPQDVAELSKGEVLFINGAGVEEWEDSVRESVDIEIVDTAKNVEIIEVADEDAQDEGDHLDTAKDETEEEDHEENEHHHGGYDPHTWLSPISGKAQARVICDTLLELDPENADYYNENYENLVKELDALTSEYQEKFANSENKTFVVPHRAFGYVARDFGLEQVALNSLTNTNDPDLQQMSKVIDFAKEHRIHTIFYEQGGSDKAAHTIATEIGGEALPIHSMEFVNEEELSQNIHYQDIVRKNLEVIYQSLQ